MADTVTLKEYLVRQRQLEEDAGRLFSGRIDECTSSMGFLCQKIFSCRSCATTEGCVGVCYACSVSCHSNCDLVELDVRSSFRCDCGLLGVSCSLKSFDFAAQKLGNWYQGPGGKCFQGQFCVDDCQLDSADTEDVMIQCRSCENWIHKTCALSLDGQSSTVLSNYSVDPNSTIPEHADAVGLGQDHISEHMDSRLLDEREEDWVCCDCLEVYPFLRRLLSFDLDVEGDDRVCLSSSQTEAAEPVASVKRGMLTLAENWQEMICSCQDCIQLLTRHHLMHLISNQSIYEPERDADAGSSLFELGNRAAMSVSDPSMLVHGMAAMDQLKRKLTSYLDVFVQENRIVTKDDIDSFFHHIKRSR